MAQCMLYVRCSTFPTYSENSSKWRQRSLGMSLPPFTEESGYGQGTKVFKLPSQLSHVHGMQLRLIVRAEGSGNGEPENEKNRPYGLGGPGTFFGFGRFQERFVGRFAMVGFAAALVMEVVTGKGIFGQLGLDPITVRYPVLLGFTFLLVAGLLGGYVVINNPPDVSRAPPNAGDGVPRDPLKTFDPNNLETMPTYTRGGVVERPSGQKGREPYVSDLDVKDK